MGIFDQWGGGKAPPPSTTTIYGHPIDSPAGQNALQEMMKSQTGSANLMQGYGQGITASEVAMKQQMAMAQMVNAAQTTTTMAVLRKDADDLEVRFNVREIDNGLMLTGHFNNKKKEMFCSDLSAVGAMVISLYTAFKLDP